MTPDFLECKMADVEMLGSPEVSDRLDKGSRVASPLLAAHHGLSFDSNAQLSIEEPDNIAAYRSMVRNAT